MQQYTIREQMQFCTDEIINLGVANPKTDYYYNILNVLEYLEKIMQNNNFKVLHTTSKTGDIKLN